jgi:PAS domain S-box-containing protein
MERPVSLVPLSEAFGDLAWAVDFDTRALLYVSPHAREFFALGEASDAALQAAIHPEDRAKVVGLRDGFVDDVATFDFRYFRGGQLRHANVRARLVRGADGRPARIEGVVSDVTDRVAAERHAVAQARRAQTLASIAAKLPTVREPTALGELACTELLRALPLDALSLRLLDPAHDDFYVAVEVGRSAGPVQRIPRARYEPFYADIGRCAFLRDVQADPRFTEQHAYFREIGLCSIAYATIEREGRLVGMLVGACFGAPIDLAREDLELLRATADQLSLALINAELVTKLRETEARYRNIVETSPEGIAIVDAGLGLRFANTQLGAMLGRGTGALIGRPFVELVPEHERPATEAMLQQLLAGATAPRALRLVTHDGALVHALVHGRAMPIESAPGLLLVLSDVTPARRLEEKLQQSQKLESLGVLAGGIAHDFNNLLVSILGNAGIALMELPPESPARPAIEDMQTASLRAADLTKQLLAYSGKGRFVITRLDLGRLVEEMSHLLTAVIAKGVVLKFRFMANLPPVEGDAAQLRQVVMNLVTNASDAIGERSGIITIATSVVHADRGYLADTYVDDDLGSGYYVSLEVSDTGAGMTPETRARIFDPFFTTKFAGRGLGLAATLGILRAHKGAIKVYSEPGRGSTFKVLIPAADTPTRIDTPHSPMVAPRVTDGALVLVVDDEEGVRNVTHRVLERAGYRVICADDGRTGIEAFERQPQAIALVVLDVTMPHIGGEEAFRRIRRIRADVPVLLSSGFSEQEATSRFAGKGLAGFLEKPFMPQTLIDKVAAALGRK